MTRKVHELEVAVVQLNGYRFEARFDRPYQPLAMDEPAPLGEDSAPSASRVLAAAIGNCLSASLLFCLGKHGVTLDRGVEARVDVEIVRNEQKRVRIGDVRVHLTVPPSVPAAVLEECRGIFEDFCTVTQSIREGIPVEVVVESR